MAQLGRPKTENPKSKPIHVRLNEAELNILDEYSKQNSITRTESIRHGIYLLEEKIKK